MKKEDVQKNFSFWRKWSARKKKVLSTDDLKKRNKTLIAITIVLGGVAAGSFFVDVVQLLAQRGFSATAIKDAQVIEYEGNTWVRYDDPKIVVEVFDADDCDECVTDEVLVRLRSLIPTLEAHRIDVRSAEGRAYAEANEIKYIPSFLFDNEVVNSDFYQQAAILFKDDLNRKQYFDATSVGVPIGEYITVPDGDNAVLLDQNIDAPVNIVLFDDPSTEQSELIYPILEKIRTEQEDALHVALKLVPDPENENTVKIAKALECLGAQVEYDELMTAFYKERDTITTSETVSQDLESLAQNLDADTESYQSCVENVQTERDVDEMILEASKFGVISTPTLFLNGQPHVGVITYQGLNDKIESLLATAKESE